MKDVFVLLLARESRKDVAAEMGVSNVSYSSSRSWATVHRRKGQRRTYQQKCGHSPRGRYPRALSSLE